MKELTVTEVQKGLFTKTNVPYNRVLTVDSNNNKVFFSTMKYHYPNKPDVKALLDSMQVGEVFNCNYERKGKMLVAIDIQKCSTTVDEYSLYALPTPEQFIAKGLTPPLWATETIPLEYYNEMGATQEEMDDDLAMMFNNYEQYVAMNVQVVH